MGFDRFAKTCSWNFFNPQERVVGLSQGFSILPHEHLSFITYFRKPLIDLLLLLRVKNKTKIWKNNYKL